MTGPNGVDLVREIVSTEPSIATAADGWGADYDGEGWGQQEPEHESAATARDREARGTPQENVSRSNEQQHAAQEPPAKFDRCPDLVGPIIDVGRQPWITLRLRPGGPELVRARARAYVLLIGWEGCGKSSLVLQIGATFVREGGAFIYFTTELDREEAAARLVGMHASESWESVLRGRVVRSAMNEALAPLRDLVILAEDNATLENLERTVRALRAENPERSIAIAIDYVQDLDVEGRDERAKVKAASRLVRRLAKRLGVLAIGVSQTSRGTREKLKDGSLTGSATVTAGAESSQLERDAYTTLALGNDREQPDGRTLYDLSTGKSRMAKGNRVVPVAYDGRTGGWDIVGEARPADVVRSERETEKRTKQIETLELAVVALAGKATAPLTRDDVERRVQGTNALKKIATQNLIDRGDLVEVIVPGKRRARPIWTEAAAKAAGMDYRAPTRTTVPAAQAEDIGATAPRPGAEP